MWENIRTRLSDSELLSLEKHFDAKQDAGEVKVCNGIEIAGWHAYY